MPVVGASHESEAEEGGGYRKHMVLIGHVVCWHICSRIQAPLLLVYGIQTVSRLDLHLAQHSTSVHSFDLCACICAMQPAGVKEVVDRIATTPFQDLAQAVEGFKWTYDKVSNSPLNSPDEAGRQPLIGLVVACRVTFCIGCPCSITSTPFSRSTLSPERTSS